MKDFDLAFHGPGRELVLSWRVPSRLQNPGKSPDLEETSYKRGWQWLRAGLGGGIQIWNHLMKSHTTH